MWSSATTLGKSAHAVYSLPVLTFFVELDNKDDENDKFNQKRGPTVTSMANILQ